MRLLHGLAVCATCAVLVPTVGCRAPQWRTAAAHPPTARPDDNPDHQERPNPANHRQRPLIETVSHQSVDEPTPSAANDTEDPFAGIDELPLDLLIAAVHTRNPSLQAAMAAWNAAAERFPQAAALDDPMFQSMFAPASFASNNSQSSYYLGFAQRVPWYGKRALRGQMAKWNSTAASWDAEEVKLHLAVSTRMAFFDYYLVKRELDLNEKNVELMQDFRSAARSRYEANQVSQQDLSAADLELGKLQQQRLELEQSERTAIARINTLLHRRPDHTLPAPPKRLTVQNDIPDASELRDTARHHRPELAALSARIQSEQNAVALACKEYYPDFEFMARYDSFWTDAQQRPQVGMNMNMPIRQDRLAAAVREAQFRVAKLVAEYAQMQDAVNEEVEIASARVGTNAKSVAVYEQTILPSAQTNLQAARSAYISGSIDFLRLLEARRQYIEQQIAYQRMLTEYHRSHADLERAVGAFVATPAPADVPPDAPASE